MDYYSDENSYSENETEYETEYETDEYILSIEEYVTYLQEECEGYFDFLEKYSNDELIEILNDYKYVYFHTNDEIEEDEYILSRIYTLVNLVLGKDNDIFSSDMDLSSLYCQLKFTIFEK